MLVIVGIVLWIYVDWKKCCARKESKDRGSKLEGMDSHCMCVVEYVTNSHDSYGHIEAPLLSKQRAAASSRKYGVRKIPDGFRNSLSYVESGTAVSE